MPAAIVHPSMIDKAMIPRVKRCVSTRRPNAFVMAACCRRVSIAAVLVLVLIGRAGAATPESAPAAVVRAALGKAGAVSTESTRDQQLAALRSLAHELVDTGAMGRRALGNVYATCTPAQQQEFLRLFDELFVRAYMQKLLMFRGPTFRIGHEQPRGDTVVVPTQIVLSDDAYAVEYEMRRADDQWRAVDVVVEGVSMTSNYSDQFASLLKNRSFDELLDLMRRKVERISTVQ